MKSISEIITSLKSLTRVDGINTTAHLCELRIKFVAPSLHVDAISKEFIGIDTDSRMDILQAWLNEVSLDEPAMILNTVARLPITVNALTPEEAEDKAKWFDQASQASWVSSFLEEPHRKSTPALETTPKYVHFYGYKGGQGRSTVLALLAKALADDGYRILLVDADIEAPSLDLLFGVSADTFAQTLMGLCGWADEFQPIAGAYTGRFNGRIDLLPCRPRIESADLDFALLVATAPLDSRIYENAAKKLQDSLPSGNDAYDIIIVDHRTGIASSVLPLINRLPGAAVVFARTDFNTATVPSELRRVVRAIFSNTASIPGVFVSFSLDPNRAASAARSPIEARVREQLLGELASVIESSDEVDSANQISTTDLSLNWIDWYHDRALLEPALPEVSRLQSDNISSINLLREALALPVGRRRELIPGKTGVAITGKPSASLSGAKDSGPFIHIPEIDKLFVPGNPYTYILGRKGTGKTRLLNEMVQRSLGIPLLVAADETKTSALRSQSIESQAWLEQCKNDAPTFWWSLIRMAIENDGGSSIENVVKKYIESNVDPKTITDRLQIKTLLLKLRSPQVFLVDGLETLVPAARIKDFVTALFEIMGTFQNDPSVANRLTIRSFVREDLAANAIQNIEQQLEGRSLRLKWSAVSILNFALSRIPTLDWIRSTFFDVCEEIEEHQATIQRSSLSEKDATELLLRIFPTRLRRNNLSTATFLRLYFSDAGGDDTNKATFYPRLYLSFLQKLDASAAEEPSPLDSDNRIKSSLLNRAYDEASGEFISETKQELSHLLSLEYDGKNAQTNSDQDKVTKFINAFAGLSTPFQHEAIIVELQTKTKFSEKSVRESLLRMKAIRMFEDRPGYAGWWRVGQLYKKGLLMKYVRN